MAIKNLFIAFGMCCILLSFAGCEIQRQGSEETASASAIPWNKPASWEGPGALGAVGFQGTH